MICIFPGDEDYAPTPLVDDLPPRPDDDYEHGTGLYWMKNQLYSVFFAPVLVIGVWQLKVGLTQGSAKEAVGPLYHCQVSCFSPKTRRIFSAKGEGSKWWRMRLDILYSRLYWLYIIVPA